MKNKFKKLTALTLLISSITSHSYGMDGQDEGAAAAPRNSRPQPSQMKQAVFTQEDEHTVACTITVQRNNPHRSSFYNLGPVQTADHFVPSFDPTLFTSNVFRLRVIGTGEYTPEEVWQAVLHALTPLENGNTPNGHGLPSIRELILDFYVSFPFLNNLSCLKCVGELLPNLNTLTLLQQDFTLSLMGQPINLRSVFPSLQRIENPSKLFSFDRDPTTCAEYTAWIAINPGISFILPRYVQPDTDLEINTRWEVGGVSFDASGNTLHFHTTVYRSSHAYRGSQFQMKLPPSVTLKFCVDEEFRETGSDGLLHFEEVVSSSRTNNVITSKHKVRLSDLVTSIYMPDLLQAFLDGRQIDISDLPDSHCQAMRASLIRNEGIFRTIYATEVQPALQGEINVLEHALQGVLANEIALAPQGQHYDPEYDETSPSLAQLMLSAVLIEDSNLRLRQSQQTSFYDYLHHQLDTLERNLHSE